MSIHTWLLWNTLHSRGLTNNNVIRGSWSISTKEQLRWSVVYTKASFSYSLYFERVRRQGCETQSLLLSVVQGGPGGSIRSVGLEKLTKIVDVHSSKVLICEVGEGLVCW